MIIFVNRFEKKTKQFRKFCNSLFFQGTLLLKIREAENKGRIIRHRRRRRTASRPALRAEHLGFLILLKRIFHRIKEFESILSDSQVEQNEARRERNQLGVIRTERTDFSQWVKLVEQ